MTIQINSIALTEQPSGCDESWEDVYSDQTSISGYVQRSQFPTKKKVELSWQFAKPETVRYFLGLVNAGAPVVYTNTDSKFYNGTNSFTGVLSVKPSEYVRGGSGLSKLTVTIEEGYTYTALGT